MPMRQRVWPVCNGCHRSDSTIGDVRSDLARDRAENYGWRVEFGDYVLCPACLKVDETYWWGRERSIQ
jgi:hypothetical protein